MFANFPWRNHFLQLQEKSWFAYPLEILFHLLDNVALDFRKELKHAKQYIYHFLKSAKQLLKSKCERSSFFDTLRRQDWYMIVRPPLGSLGMDTWKDSYSKHRIHCTWTYFQAVYYHNDQRSYTWFFQLDSDLRLNLTFSTFYIKDFFTYCGWQKMILRDILPTSIKRFSLCGRHPVFIFYSSSTFVSVQIKYDIILPVDIYLLFAVFARNIVSTMHRKSIIPVTNQFVKSDDIFVHVIHGQNELLSTFRIHTRKTHKICVWVNFQQNITYILINGATVTALKPFILHINNNFTCSSTFQLVIQIFTIIGSNYLASHFYTSLHSHLSYETFSADFKTIKFDHRDNWKLIFPVFFLSNKSNIYILQFKSPQQIQLNLTVLSVRYEGIETSDCRYGGITIFDQNIHILDICSNYGTYRPSRNIYSTFSNLAIVMYSYFPYSNISTTILVSTTKCKAIRIHLCEYARLPVFGDGQCWREKITPKSNINAVISHLKYHISATVEAGKCGILQLSTDFVDTFCPQEKKHYRTMCKFFLLVKLETESEALITGYAEEIKVKSETPFLNYDLIFTVISKSLFCYDLGTKNNTQLVNKIHSGTRSCPINGGDQQTSIFHINTLASIIELITVTITSGKRNIDFVMRSQKSKSSLIKTQQLKLNGSFDTFHEYIDHALCIRLVDKSDCEYFKDKHAVVYLKFVHSFVVDVFHWIWEFQAHISCLEPVFYAFIAQKASYSYYSVLKEISSKTLLEAIWINSVPSRLKHDKCLSIYWRSFSNVSAKIYNCTKSMILREVFPHESFDRSWKSVSELCKEIGAHLPVFRSMYDLEDFLTVLRHFGTQHPNAIFIGLYMIPGKNVSKRFLFCHKKYLCQKHSNIPILIEPFQRTIKST